MLIWTPASAAAAWTLWVVQSGFQGDGAAVVGEDVGVRGELHAGLCEAGRLVFVESGQHVACIRPAVRSSLSAF